MTTVLKDWANIFEWVDQSLSDLRSCVCLRYRPKPDVMTMCVTQLEKEATFFSSQPVPRECSFMLVLPFQEFPRHFQAISVSIFHHIP